MRVINVNFASKLHEYRDVMIHIETQAGIVSNGTCTISMTGYSVPFLQNPSHETFISPSSSCHGCSSFGPRARRELCAVSKPASDCYGQTPSP